MAYDGSGRRISKTRWVKSANSQDWEKDLVTHYTGIGTEIREQFRNESLEKVNVVVNMPEGFGRYGVEDASGPDMGFGAGYIPNTKFEWYLKNHLGSTMLVYGTEGNATSDPFRVSAPLAAYDYRAFGEMVELTPPPTGKVTENFTGKEHDDEIALDYFGARYLDPMLGMWTSVDPARQFASPYLYAGNGYNPVNGVDPDGNYKLELNEDNSIKSMSENDDLNRVSVFNADGSLLNTFAAPPSESYFFSKTTEGEYEIVGKYFDNDMMDKVSDLMERARSGWPLNFREWGSDKSLDFKHKYYKGITTVGVLNGTIMTARDAGNAMWGGWTRHMYFCPILGCPELLPRLQAHLFMRALSEGYSWYKRGQWEDRSSAVMQSWGFENSSPF